MNSSLCVISSMFFHDCLRVHCLQFNEEGKLSKQIERGERPYNIARNYCDKETEGTTKEQYTSKLLKRCMIVYINLYRQHDQS